MIITKSISITIDPAEHLVYTADPQPDILKTSEGTVNIKESAVAVRENQSTDRDLNLETIQLSLKQELNNISVKKL